MNRLGKFLCWLNQVSMEVSQSHVLLKRHDIDYVDFECPTTVIMDCSHIETLKISNPTSPSFRPFFNCSYTRIMLTFVLFFVFAMYFLLNFRIHKLVRSSILKVNSSVLCSDWKACLKMLSTYLRLLDIDFFTTCNLEGFKR